MIMMRLYVDQIKRKTRSSTMPRSVSNMCLWFDTTGLELKSESIFSCVSIFYFIFSGHDIIVVVIMTNFMECFCMCATVQPRRSPQYTNSTYAIYIYENIEILLYLPVRNVCKLRRTGTQPPLACMYRLVSLHICGRDYQHYWCYFNFLHPHQMTHPIYRFQYVENNAICCCRYITQR